MKIAVLGTGMVGRAVAGRLHELGHEVAVGTRDVDATMAVSEPDNTGAEPFAAWLRERPAVTLKTFAAAAAEAELVVIATLGRVAQAVLESAGAANLAGKVLLDITNPLDFSAGMPPTLLVKDTDSLGEQLQRAFPEAKVVKTLNTLSAHLMVDPRGLADGDHSVFVSGNDDQAKKVVTELLTSIGHRDIIDLGDITTARGTEMLLPVWVRLYGLLGSPDFNFKIVR